MQLTKQNPTIHGESISGDTQQSQPNAAQKAVNYILLWKVALTKLVIRCSIVGSTYYLGCMPDSGWADWTPAQRHKFIVGMAVNIATVLSTFLDKAEKSLSSGNYIPPDDGGDGGSTQVWTRKQVDTVTTSAPPPPAPAAAPAQPILARPTTDASRTTNPDTAQPAASPTTLPQ